MYHLPSSTLPGDTDPSAVGEQPLHGLWAGLGDDGAAGQVRVQAGGGQDARPAPHA